MHLRNPFTGKVSTLESIVLDSYEQLDRDDVDPDDWAEIDPEGREQYLYANTASGELNTLSDCMAEFDRTALGHGIDGRWQESLYIEVVLSEDRDWVRVDGAKLESPIDWQRELIDVFKTSSEVYSMLSDSPATKNGWDIQEPLNRALYEHALEGNVHCCKVLMDAGADVEAQAKIHQGFTPLHGAASRGYVELAQLLLDAGANPNAVEDRYDGMTPLHFAASNDETDVGLLLLSRGGDPEAKTRDGETCIEQARSLGNEILGEAFKAHVAEKRAAKLEAAWGSTQPTKDNLQAAQPTQAAPVIATGRRPRF